MEVVGDAIRGRDEEMVQLLLGAGMPADRSSLKQAVSMGQSRVVDMLLDRG